jgi:hypothetical protein
MATVAWVAAPHPQGTEKSSPEIGRLLSGTRVKVLGRKGEWYRFKYNAAETRVGHQERHRALEHPPRLPAAGGARASRPVPC